MAGLDLAESFLLASFCELWKVGIAVEASRCSDFRSKMGIPNWTSGQSTR